MGGLTIQHGFLAAAIVLEVAGTLLLKQTNNFRVLIPTLAMALCYAGSFYCLTFALKTIPVGVAYAVWSGVGIVLIASIGWVYYKEALDAAALIGMALVIVGVLVINLFSKSVAA